MAKGKLPLIGLAAATVTLSACVVKVWEAGIQPAEGSYAGALDVTLSSNNEPVLAGFKSVIGTNEQSILIAKYDSAGNRLWMHEAHGLRQGGMPRGNRFITTDSSDAVVFAGFTLGAPSTLVKLNPDGSLEWQVNVGINQSFPLDIKTIGDDLILVAEVSGWGNSLHGFSGNGDLIWSHPEPASCENTGCANELEDFPYNSSPPPAYSSTEIAVTGDNQILFNDGNAIVLLNTSGEVLSHLSANSIGLTSMPDIATNKLQTAVLGTGPQGLEVVTLDNNLTVTTRYTTDIQHGFYSMLDINENATVCVAGINENILSVQGFGESISWFRDTEHELNFEGISSVSLNEQDACHVSTIEPNQPPEGASPKINPWSSTIQIYDRTGNITDNLNIPHFVGYSLRVEGRTIYSAGQSADYVDGNYPLETNAATLFKHQVR